MLQYGRRNPPFIPTNRLNLNTLNHGNKKEQGS